MNIPIKGKVITPNHKNILNATIKLSMDSTLTSTTDTNGSFIFNLSKIGNYKIKASRSIDVNKANGLTALDLALIQSHILGKTSLNSPYKIIAADVNGDGKVTALDLVFIKRIILGIDTVFTKTTTGEKRLWTFIDSSYKFPDTTNPFPYKDSILYKGLNLVQTNQTFIGVKLGDVNWDWNAALARGINSSNLNLTDDWIIDNNVNNIVDEMSSINSYNKIPILPMQINSDNKKIKVKYLRSFNKQKN